MNTFKKGLAILIFLSLLVASFPGQAAAKYPEKPITIVCPWAAGGMAFLMAMELGNEMEKILGKRVLVVSQTGGAGAAGTTYVKQAPADGYTLFQAWIAPFVMVPLQNPQIGYDPLKDFTLLAYMTENPVVALTHKDSPYNTLKEFVDYVRANPGKFFKFGGGPTLSVHSLFGNEVFRNAGVKVQGVYYVDSGAPMLDLVGKTLDVSFHTFEALKRFPTIKALGVFSEKRYPEFPDVPTVLEQGLKAPTVKSWSGIAAPKGIPPEVRDYLVETIKKILQDPKFQQKIFNNMNQFVVYHGPEGFAEIIRWDMEQMKGPVQRASEMEKKK